MTLVAFLMLGFPLYHFSKNLNIMIKARILEVIKRLTSEKTCSWACGPAFYEFVCFPQFLIILKRILSILHAFVAF